MSSKRPGESNRKPNNKDLGYFDRGLEDGTRTLKRPKKSQKVGPTEKSKTDDKTHGDFVRVASKESLGDDRLVEILEDEEPLQKQLEDV